MIPREGPDCRREPLKDHLEAIGHKEALDYVRQLSRSDQSARQADTRQIHTLVVGRAEPLARETAAPREPETAFAAHEKLVTIILSAPESAARAGCS